MRTTIRLDDDLLSQAKALAAAQRRSLNSVIEDALREALQRQQKLGRTKRIRLKTMKGNGLQPGVDLDDTSALLELMERADS
ncbi:MAG: YlcI/YnfO family protein [Candidatus Latescibacterota bacterium]|nr:YlcI/YnfO family protein [Candidatus Latescibacterota bacterium]